MNRRHFIKSMGVVGASCWTLPLLAQSGSVAWFCGIHGNVLCGAFYAYINKIT